MNTNFNFISSQSFDRLPELITLAGGPFPPPAPQEAAVAIQAAWRGHAVRSRLHASGPDRNSLNPSLAARAKLFVDQPYLLAKLPRAAAGQTPVYLPKGLPVVLKEAKEKCQTRLTKMSQARDICQRNNYKRLQVPTAIVYKNFIIESRLPIARFDRKSQMGFYYENRARFTPAVRDFLGFFFQCTLNDITVDKVRYAPCDTPIARYDNVCLYSVNGKPTIGLPDLEDFDPDCPRTRADWCAQKCITATYLFPYHFDTILEVAEEFDPKIRRFEKPLEKRRDSTLSYFNTVYHDHKKFLLARRITPEHPALLPTLTADRIDEFKALFQDIPQFVEFNFSECIASFLNLFKLVLQDRIKKLDAPLTEWHQLLAVRTFNLKLDVILDHMADLFAIDLKDNEPILRQMTIDILQEFARGGEIAYYRPLSGKDSNEDHCIFV